MPFNCNTEYLRRRLLLKSIATSALITPFSTAARLSPSAMSAEAILINESHLNLQKGTTSTAAPLASEALVSEASAHERLKSLVVLEDGEQIVARNFSGKDVQSAVNIKSVSKSVMSALVGVALQRGVFDSVKQTLGELTPELIPTISDSRVAKLSIHNLLTMQTGLQRTSGRNYGAWVSSSDWVAYVLTRRFVAEPGGRMLYSTGDWHVLGAVLSQLTGRSLLSLSRDWLGKPLNIDFAPWTRDPQGRYLGGNEMSLSPVHLAKFGQLYLDGGRNVLPGGWVEQSLTPRTRSPWSGDAYGYGWFIRDRMSPSYYYGRGYGGQFVFVLPSTGRVVVMISDWTRSARGGDYTETLHDLIVRYCV